MQAIWEAQQLRSLACAKVSGFLSLLMQKACVCCSQSTYLQRRARTKKHNPHPDFLKNWMHLNRNNVQPLFPFIFYSGWRERRKRGWGRAGEMKTNACLGLILENRTQSNLDSHFCGGGVFFLAKFPDSYSLLSKTPWIHSCTKYVSLSQTLNLIM